MAVVVAVAAKHAWRAGNFDRRLSCRITPSQFRPAHLAGRQNNGFQPEALVTDFSKNPAESLTFYRIDPGLPFGRALTRFARQLLRY
jgi:hypothetical protein